MNNPTTPPPAPDRRALYRHAREALGLSRVQLAQALGLSRYTVIAKENGYPAYPISDMDLLALEGLQARVNRGEDPLSPVAATGARISE